MLSSRWAPQLPAGIHERPPRQKLLFLVSTTIKHKTKTKAQNDVMGKRHRQVFGLPNTPRGQPHHTSHPRAGGGVSRRLPHLVRLEEAAAAASQDPRLLRRRHDGLRPHLPRACAPRSRISSALLTRPGPSRPQRHLVCACAPRSRLPRLRPSGRTRRLLVPVPAGLLVCGAQARPAVPPPPSATLGLSSLKLILGDYSAVRLSSPGLRFRYPGFGSN